MVSNSASHINVASLFVPCLAGLKRVRAPNTALSSEDKMAFFACNLRENGGSIEENEAVYQRDN